MSDFSFTSPEGKEYTISGPEGSTREQAFEMLPNKYPELAEPKEEPGFFNSIIPSKKDWAEGFLGRTVLGLEARVEQPFIERAAKGTGPTAKKAQELLKKQQEEKAKPKEPTPDTTEVLSQFFQAAKENPGATLGEFVKAGIVDPELLIPIFGQFGWEAKLSQIILKVGGKAALASKFAKAAEIAAKTGVSAAKGAATLGGAEAIAQTAEQGKYDPQKIQNMAAMGAAITPVAAAGRAAWKSAGQAFGGNRSVLQASSSSGEDIKVSLGEPKITPKVEPIVKSTPFKEPTQLELPMADNIKIYNEGKFKGKGTPVPEQLNLFFNHPKALETYKAESLRRLKDTHENLAWDGVKQLKELDNTRAKQDITERLDELDKQKELTKEEQTERIWLETQLKNINKTPNLFETQMKSPKNLPKLKQAEKTREQISNNGVWLRDPVTGNAKKYPYKKYLEIRDKQRLGGVGNKQGGAIHPDLLLGAEKLWDWMKENGGTAENYLRMWQGTFNPNTIERAITDARDPKSNKTVIFLTPDEFLSLASTRSSIWSDVSNLSRTQQKRASIREGLKTKEGLREIPYVAVGYDAATNSWLVTGHEGRHRADVLKEQGIDKMPVEIQDWTMEMENNPNIRPTTIKAQPTAQNPDYTTVIKDAPFLDVRKKIQEYEQSKQQAKPIAPHPLGGVGKKEGGAIDPSVFTEPIKKVWEKIREVAKEHPIYRSPDMMSHQAELADGLHEQSTLRTVDEIFTIKALEQQKTKATEMEVEWDKLDPAVQEHMEGTITIDPKFKPFIDVYKKVNTEFQDTLRRVKTLRGEDPAIDVDRISRFAVGHGQWTDNLFDLDFGAKSIGFGRMPSTLHPRTVLGLELPNGERLVIKNEGNTISLWEKGNEVAREKIDLNIDKGSVIESGSIAGKDISGAKVVDVTTQEATTHTDVKYLPGGITTALLKLQEMKAYERELTFLKESMKSPLFEGMMSDKPMDGYRQFKGQERLPMLRGKYFSNRLANVLEDYFGMTDFFIGNKVANGLRGLNNLIIKALMLIPLAHMANEGTHWIPARGFDWVTKQGWSGLKNTSGEAINSVLNMEGDFLQVLKHGGSLLSVGVRNGKYWENVARDVARQAAEHQPFRQLAQEIGFKLSDISYASSDAMWLVRDMMYMGLIKENLRKGIPMRENIREVEKHMPNYRIPDEVIGSRDLSRIMRDRSLSVFSRYHYGMVRSFAEYGRSLINAKDHPHEAIEATGKMAAAGLMYSVLYPYFDDAWTWAARETGLIKPTSTVHARRAGPGALIEHAEKIATDEEEPAQLARALLTPAPALLMGFELGNNIKLWNKQPIFDWGDNSQQIAKDVIEYSVSAFHPAKLGLNVSEGKRTGAQTALEVLGDVKLISEEQELRKERAKHRREIARAKKRMREDLDLQSTP